MHGSRLAWEKNQVMDPSALKTEPGALLNHASSQCQITSCPGAPNINAKVNGWNSPITGILCITT